jgi:hypothetical protein
MPSSAKDKPTSKRPWEEATDEELLNWRICDLKLTIEGTDLEGRIGQLHQELAGLGFAFLPSCYLADEWFCPDGVPIIAIPFFLAHPRLKQLEQKMVLEVEGGTKDSCMRLLRHETGHALNYAYLLHRRRRWRELFGSFSTDYPESYRPQPYSRRFVRHLENWYAQYHPDEDFAETFAVWLDPHTDWRRRYKGWKALSKLEYVDALMNEIAGQPPKVTGGQKISQASRLTQKLATYYAHKKRAFAEDMPDFYDSDLRRIFSEETRKNERAASFLRHHRLTIVDSVSRWTGEKKFTVSRLLRNLIARCQELKLYCMSSDAETTTMVVAFLTTMVMNYRFTGKLKRYP